MRLHKEKEENKWIVLFDYFIISASSNGITFKDIFKGRSSGITTSPEHYDFNDIKARYIKITVNGNSINNWVSITEIETCWENDHDPMRL